MKSGFVNLFGRPNAGKSTLLNALVGEKLAIVSRKVQTTRHRIKGIVSTPEYQVVFSDTPGIIEPEYALHERMMQAVRSGLEDADVALLVVDVQQEPGPDDAVFSELKLNVPAIVVLNKVDVLLGKASPGVDKAAPARITTLAERREFFEGRPYCRCVVEVSALHGSGIDRLMDAVLEFLPEGLPFFPDGDMTDLPTRFFVGELVREKIYELFSEEIPYHSTVIVQEFTEKPELTKVRAEIVVQRETQKGILLGEGGKKIKELGTAARKEIEAFLGRKVFLELFVKVRPKWRDNGTLLREYGYDG